MRITLAFLLALAPLTAHAQSATLASTRADLASYDLSGSRTLETLRGLGPLVAGDGPDAHEAAYLRAMAATDVHLAALALADTALDARLATALGVPSDQVTAELRSELSAAQTGLFRAPAAAELQLLGRIEQFAAGPFVLELRDPREAAVFALGMARAASTNDYARVPMSTASAVGSVTGLRELRAGLEAYERASRAARDGDPLLVACTSALDAARDAMVAHELRATPTIADSSLAVAAGDAPASAGEVPDVLIVVDASRVAIACGARMHVRLGAEPSTELPSAGCRALGSAQVIALPATLPTVPGPIDSLVSAFAALALPSGTVIAVAPTEAAPMHMLTRTLRSLAHANLTPTLAALTSDGVLRTSALAIATTADAPSATIHVRLGGYAIERVHGHDAQVPRVRSASGLAYDHGGLTTALTADVTRALAIDAMGPVPAAEALRTMRLLAATGARVTLALP